MKGRTRYPIFFGLTLLLILLAGFDSDALARHRRCCCGFGGYGSNVRFGGFGWRAGFGSFNNGCCPAPQPVCCPVQRTVVIRRVISCCPVTCKTEECVTPQPEKMPEPAPVSEVTPPAPVPEVTPPAPQPEPYVPPAPVREHKPKH